MTRILIVDDEAGMREFLSILLEREGFQVECAEDGEEALQAVRKAQFDLIISDLRMPNLDGVRLLEGLQKVEPEIPVVLVTAYASAESAIQAMKLGAYDYLTKPFRVEEIKQVISRALESKAARVAGVFPWSGEAFPRPVEGLIGRSPKMIELYKLISKVATVSGTVLVTGESGTGKELVARTIHKNSDHATKPFLAISCGAIPETLLESELFGHVKGAFTGAVAAKAGLFEVANGGTVFLDEIGETSPAIQVKLLRVLQERVFRRVGGTDDIEVDVRVIAATHQDLKDLIQKGRFREDLYYRLNVIPIHLPSLRERREDIPLLAMNFLAKYSQETKRPIRGIAPDAMELLLRNHWPGNVRELENAIERAVALGTAAVLTPESLPEHIKAESPESRDERPDPGNRETEIHPRLSTLDSPLDLDAVVSRVERDLILEALRQAGGVQKKAAQVLGLSFESFRYRMKKHGIDPEEGRRAPSEG
ncbi:MAG: sigma-54-dependent transcriptional regulator [Candidatus Methylomirabilales bacterium]